MCARTELPCTAFSQAQWESSSSSQSSGEGASDKNQERGSGGSHHSRREAEVQQKIDEKMQIVIDEAFKIGFDTKNFPAESNVLINV